VRSERELKDETQSNYVCQASVWEMLKSWVIPLIKGGYPSLMLK
jgi:hypothetical protein